MPTVAEQTMLCELLEEGHRALDNYLSNASGCLLVRALPVLTKSDERILFNIYRIFRTMAMFEEKYSKPLVLSTVIERKTQIVFKAQQQ